MRRSYYMLGVGVTFVFWIISRYIPRMEPLGLLFLGLSLMMLFLDFAAYERSYRAVGPNINTTLASTTPAATVTLAGFPEDSPCHEVYIYKNHGTNWFPRSGGGPIHGYTAIPSDYVDTWKGEDASVIWNCDFEVYRENPDPNTGEQDIRGVPGEIMDAIKNLEGYHPRSPVLWSYFPHQANFLNKRVQFDLKERVKVLEQDKKQLEDELDAALKRITKYSKVDRHRRETYEQPTERRSREQYDGEVID